jgi:predicted transposase YdaD
MATPLMGFAGSPCEEMIYDATLKRMFQRVPNRLLSHALGHNVAVKQILPTEMITVENLHPDLLFETEDGELIHTELQGYSMGEFAVRNLIYFGLVLRDYKRPPTQIVFWIGGKSIGVADGLHFDPALHYQYRVIDLRQLDPEFLVESPDVSESIFGILCKLKDKRAVVRRILARIRTLPASEQREAASLLLVLSGLRGLTSLVKREVASMPVTINLHENEFFEGIYQEGKQEGLLEGRLDGARLLLLDLLEQKFGTVPPAEKQRILNADLRTIQAWTQRVLQSATLLDVLD